MPFPGWLPTGQEQYAPPVSRKLPVPLELSYVVGGGRVIRDFSAAVFNPHWWVFEKGTAKWYVGYDLKQLPSYEVKLIQPEVFNVLLVDYWKPPVELPRYNQYVAALPQVAVAQDAAAAAMGGSADGGGSGMGGSADNAAYTPVGGAG